MTPGQARSCEVVPRKRVDAARKPAHQPSGPPSSSPLSKAITAGDRGEETAGGHPKETLDTLRDAYWKVIRTPSVKFEV